MSAAGARSSTTRQVGRGFIASYASQEELEEAIQDAAERIEAGELPESTVPLYETAPPKRQTQPLRAVRAAG